MTWAPLFSPPKLVPSTDSTAADVEALRESGVAGSAQQRANAQHRSSVSTHDQKRFVEVGLLPITPPIQPLVG